MRKNEKSSNILRNITNTQLLIISIIFIVPGAALAVGLDKPLLWQKLAVAFVTELGFALFIAWVIIITVDEREKSKAVDWYIEAERRLNSRMYLSQIIDLDLPKSVSEEIYEYIITSKLLKDEQLLEYYIVRVGKYIMMRQHYEATYVNVGSSDFNFTPPFNIYANSSAIIQKLPDEKWGLQRVTCLVQRFGQNQWSELAAKPVSVGPIDGGIDLDGNIVLKPGDKIRTIVDYNVPKYIDDNEIFTSAQLSEKTTVSIRYDVEDFDIGFRAIHPRKDCTSSVDINDGKKIIFYYPLLPGNGFILWWRPKSKS